MARCWLGRCHHIRGSVLGRFALVAIMIGKYTVKEIEDAGRSRHNQPTDMSTTFLGSC
jgi:hypothetical protein